MRSIAVTPISDADVKAVLAIEGPSTMDEPSLRDEMARAWSRIWVARERSGPPVAFLVSWHVADELHVLNVATAPPHRRRGFARALIDTALAYAKDQRVRHVLLEVRRSNRGAILLYRSVGFYAMGVRVRYYPDDEDAVEMVLQIDPETRAIVPHDDEVKLDG